MGKTKIEWASQIMSTDVASQPSTAVESPKLLTATAGAPYEWIALPRQSLIESSRSMQHRVMKTRFCQFQVPWTIVTLLAIFVVNLFSFFEWSAKLLFHYNSMFINVASNVSEMMVGHPQHDVTVRSDGSSAAPVWVLRT